MFQPSEIFLNFATQPSLLPITSPCPPAQIQSPDLPHPVTVCREKQRESYAVRGTRTRGSSSRVLSWGMKMFQNLGSALYDSQAWNVTAKSAAVFPQACFLLLTPRHLFSLSLSWLLLIHALRPGSDIRPGLLCTLFFPPLPLGSVRKFEDEIEGTNNETQERIPYLV